MANWTLAFHRSELLIHLGLDSSDSGNWGNTILDDLINRSYAAALENFGFRAKETSTTFVTVAGTKTYAIPADLEALEQLSIVDPDSSSHSNLQPIEPADYELNFVDTEDARSTPTHYMRRGSSIILWPTPDVVYTLVHYYRKLLPDLTQTTDTLGLPKSWDEIIHYGAVSRGFIRLGDYERAEASSNIQSKFISDSMPTKAKERNDSHRHVGVSYPYENNYHRPKYSR